MDVLVALEHRFTRTPDGAVWTATGFGREHWDRYLRTFANVTVLARVLDVAHRAPPWRRVDGDRVDVVPLPHYIGPREYLSKAWAVRRTVNHALTSRADAAVILRVPGTIGTIATTSLRMTGRPFGVEVIGDPHEVLAPGSLRVPFRPLMRVWATRALKVACASACASLYVTSGTLQRRYPPSRAPGSAAYAASDAELGPAAYVAEPRGPAAAAGTPFRVVTVGTLEQLYKGTDVLIRAIAQVVAQGLDAKLAIVGDGRHRDALEDLARAAGVARRVRFAGRLPSGEAVRKELDRAHLFVLPSRTEGMPRALLEAMARGLPCLATAVGGIPELLPPSALMPCEPAAIATRIRELADDAPLLAEMSHQNLDRARAFEERTLQPIHEAFHRHLADATERWARSVAGAMGPI